MQKSIEVIRIMVKNKIKAIQLAHPVAYRKFFTALGNDTRFAIVNLLRSGPRTVREIGDALNMEQSHVSHNMRCLLDCGFVTVTLKGKNRVYQLEEETVVPLLNDIDGHLQRFYSHLKDCGCC